MSDEEPEGWTPCDTGDCVRTPGHAGPCSLGAECAVCERILRPEHMATHEVMHTFTGRPTARWFEPGTSEPYSNPAESDTMKAVKQAAFRRSGLLDGQNFPNDNQVKVGDVEPECICKDHPAFISDAECPAHPDILPSSGSCLAGDDKTVCGKFQDPLDVGWCDNCAHEQACHASVGNLEE